MNEIKYYERLLHKPHSFKLKPPGGLTWYGFGSSCVAALIVFIIIFVAIYPNCIPLKSEYELALYQAEVLHDKRFVAYTIDNVKYVKFYDGKNGTIYGPTRIDTFMLDRQKTEVEQ